MPLLRPADHNLPEGTTLVAMVPPEGLTLYRLLDGATPRLQDFEPRLSRSQAERQGVPEVFRTSVSHWLEEGQAGEVARHRTFYVARVELEPHKLVRVALTEEQDPGHVDVWAHPQRLLDAVGEVLNRRRGA